MLGYEISEWLELELFQKSIFNLDPYKQTKAHKKNILNSLFYPLSFSISSKETMKANSFRYSKSTYVMYFDLLGHAKFISRLNALNHQHVHTLNMLFTIFKRPQSSNPSHSIRDFWPGEISTTEKIENESIFFTEYKNFRS